MLRSGPREELLKPASWQGEQQRQRPGSDEATETEKGQDAKLWGEEMGCILDRYTGARASRCSWLDHTKETEVSRSVILKWGYTLEPSGGI